MVVMGCCVGVEEITRWMLRYSVVIVVVSSVAEVTAVRR